MAKAKKTKERAMQRITDIKERDKAIEKALKDIEKDFGKGSIMRLGQKADTKISVSPSGSLALDVALGVGGYPKGRIIEVFGAESSGKTTIALHAVAEMQKNGGIVAFIDAEHALDPVYAKNLGVNIDELFLSQPNSGEEGLEIADKLISTGAVDMIVVDSVAALTPRVEIDGDMGDSHVGLQARMMSQALRKLSSTINRTKTIAIFINQVRENIGGYGSPQTTPGGRALKFYSTIRLEVYGTTKIEEKDKTAIGKETKIKVVKNKVAPPFKIAEVEIMYGEGISHIGEVLTMAVEKDIVGKAGSWYSYGEDKIGQGSEKAKKYLKEHPEILEEVEQKVSIAYGIKKEETPENENQPVPEKKKKETKKAKDEKVKEAEPFTPELTPEDLKDFPTEEA